MNTLLKKAVRWKIWQKSENTLTDLANHKTEAGFWDKYTGRQGRGTAAGQGKTGLWDIRRNNRFQISLCYNRKNLDPSVFISSRHCITVIKRVFTEKVPPKW